MPLPVLDMDLVWADGSSARAQARKLVGDALLGAGALTIRLPQPEVDDARLDLLLGLFDLPESSKWQAQGEACIRTLRSIGSDTDSIVSME